MTWKMENPNYKNKNIDKKKSLKICERTNFKGKA